MRGNVVVAAIVFGVALVLSSVILVFGIRTAANRAMLRFEAAVTEHGKAVERGGERAGEPIKSGLAGIPPALSGIPPALAGIPPAFDRHGQSLEKSGERIAHPQIPTNLSIRMEGTVPVPQPLRVEGPADDGALPVNARLAK